MSHESAAHHGQHRRQSEAAPDEQPSYLLVPFELLAPAAEAAAVHEFIALAARLHDLRRR